MRSGRNGAFPYEVSYKKEYITDMTIRIFDEVGESAIEIQLIDAFPLAIGDSLLNWGEQNQFLAFQTSFAFKEWNQKNITVSRKS